MIKQFKGFYLSMLLVFSLAACEDIEGTTGRKGSITGGSIDPEGKYEIIGEYGSFTGQFYRVIKLNKKESYSFVLKDKSKEGILRLFVINKKNKDAYEVTHDRTEFKPPYTGLYEISIVAIKHKEGFVVKWSK